jgi:aminomethyltransferase
VSNQLKQTPLYDMHRKYGGRIIDYAGWALPVQFTSIIEEHRTVRDAAGLFDVSDMGEVEITGPGAKALVQRAVTADIGRARPGRVVYSPMCNHRGGVVDDILIYVLGAERYLAVVNAANIEKDFTWLQGLAKEQAGASVVNRSDEVAQLAIQGPRAGDILYGLTRADLSGLGYYRALEDVEVAGIRCSLVSRTGYTGEDGFELYCAPDDAAVLWERLMETGEEVGLVPAGLGCRDTLRLEAGMPLYGQELDEVRTPLEAGLDRFVALDKGEFVGREALQRQQEEGRTLALVGLEMVDRGVPRTGYPVLIGEGQVGYVTSGSYAPSLDRHIGMAYVPPAWSAPGTGLGVSIRNRVAMAKVVTLPFYRRNKEG